MPKYIIHAPSYPMAQRALMSADQFSKDYPNRKGRNHAVIYSRRVDHANGFHNEPCHEVYRTNSGNIVARCIKAVEGGFVDAD